MGELTPERLAEIEAAAEKATPGPWVSRPDMHRHTCDTRPHAVVCENGDEGGAYYGETILFLDWLLPTGKRFESLKPHEQRAFANARFIALSRSAVPDLVAEVRALREEIARVRAECVRLAKKCGEGK